MPSPPPSGVESWSLGHTAVWLVPTCRLMALETLQAHTHTHICSHPPHTVAMQTHPHMNMQLAGIPHAHHHMEPHERDGQLFKGPCVSRHLFSPNPGLVASRAQESLKPQVWPRCLMPASGPSQPGVPCRARAPHSQAVFLPHTWQLTAAKSSAMLHLHAGRTGSNPRCLGPRGLQNRQRHQALCEGDSVGGMSTGRLACENAQSLLDLGARQG